MPLALRYFGLAQTSSGLKPRLRSGPELAAGEAGPIWLTLSALPTLLPPRQLETAVMNEIVEALSERDQRQRFRPAFLVAA